MNIKIGDIVTIKAERTQYRIVSIYGEFIVLCKLGISRFELIELSKKAFFEMLYSDKIEITADQEDQVYDVELLSDTAKERFYKKRDAFREILDIYGPGYMKLCGRSSKNELYNILDKYNYSIKTFWRDCLKYFQSGLKERVLLDSKLFGLNKGKEYTHTAKTGKKGEYGAVGIPLTSDVIEHFEEALKAYKTGRHKSIKSCYDYMNNLYYSKIETIGGVPTMCLVPENERPTYKQFYLYVKKHLSEAERDIIKTSQMEFRNNQRLLKSDSLFDVAGPGDLVEIDACEADVSLVSMTDCNQTIGRPIVYFMIDVYSRIILAASIAFDNNSMLGITNLFLNLSDDKQEYCKRYGVLYEDERLWPSNIIPNRLRVDRGSEFKSKEFGRICNALGIQKDIVSGGSGSLKGVVEQSFHQMHSKQNESLEDHGLIEKRHDSNHHKEATLNIEQYTKMVINFVLTHNQTYLETYPLTKKMIEEKILAIPAKLWHYGVENELTPRPIINKTQYLYELMTPVKVSVSRKGISHKGLYYLSDESYISTLMFKARNKKISLEARMDMRNVGYIYVLHDNRLIQLPLNERITGNAEYMGMTMKQYEDYRKGRGMLEAKGRVYNEQLSAYSSAVNNSIVAEAAKASEYKSNDKNMRQAREVEKQRVSNEKEIAERFEKKKKNKIPVSNPEIEKAKENIEPETSTEEQVKECINLTEEEMMEKRKKALLDFEEEDW